MMRVISRQRIEEFIKRYPKARPSLDQWYQVALQATWTSLADVRRVYPHADVVGRRTVFNIAGNNFRLIARINYQRQIMYILFILTHAEYDKGDWKE
jgi:mRNA interferase HigB